MDRAVVGAGELATPRVIVAEAAEIGNRHLPSGEGVAVIDSNLASILARSSRNFTWLHEDHRLTLGALVPEPVALRTFESEGAIDLGQARVLAPLSEQPPASAVDSGVGVVAVKLGDGASQPLALRERQPVEVELAERDQGRPADRGVAGLVHQGNERIRLGPAGPQAVDQIAARGRIGGVPEQRDGALPSPQGGQRHRRVRLLPQPYQPKVEVGRRSILGGCLLLERCEGVWHTLGVVGVEAGDGAAGGGVKAVLGQDIGERRQEITSYRAQARRPSARSKGLAPQPAGLPQGG